MSALNGAETVFVSPFDGGSVYIADDHNARILKFAPNSTQGTVIAGGLRVRGEINYHKTNVFHNY